jgi:hypothetical protein
MAHEILAAVIVLGWIASVGSQSAPNSSSAPCPVTAPNHHSLGVVPEGPNWHADEGIGTALWPGGKVVFRPGKAGQVLPDGSLQMKFLWAKPLGPMSVEGKRLDAEAAPLRVRLDPSRDADRFQPSYLIFPTPGCWEITARVGNSHLTFVTEVAKPTQPFGSSIPTSADLLATLPEQRDQHQQN